MSRLAGTIDPATFHRYQLPPDPNAAEHIRQLAEEFGWYPTKTRRAPAEPKRTHAEQLADFVEDIEWLLEQGECVASICQRLNRKPTAVERRLFRAGRHDLAAIFGRYR